MQHSSPTTQSESHSTIPHLSWTARKKKIRSVPFRRGTNWIFESPVSRFLCVSWRVGSVYAICGARRGGSSKTKRDYQIISWLKSGKMLINQLVLCVELRFDRVYIDFIFYASLGRLCECSCEPSICDHCTPNDTHLSAINARSRDIE